MTPRIVSSDKRLRRGALGRKEVLLAAAVALAPLAAWADAAADYAEHCASCHAGNRLGGTGPALIPETLSRAKNLDQVIAHGRPSTQMMGFADQLSPERIAALVEFIKAPLAETPSWTVADIAASREMVAD